MKIAIYTLLRNSSWGGSENIWFRLAIYALEHQHDVLIIASNSLAHHPNLLIIKEKGAQVLFIKNYLVNYIDRLWNKIDPKFASKKFLKILTTSLSNFNPALILVNQPGCFDIGYDPTASEYLTSTPFKYVICSHSYLKENVLDESKQMLIREIFQKAEQRFYVAKVQAEVIMSQLDLLNLNRAYFFNPLSVRLDANLSYPTDKEIKMAMVSSLDIKWKGHDLIIEILSNPNWKARNWTLDIYGSGPDEHVLLKLIAEKGLKERIFLKGFTSDVEKIWEEHHILLMPSRVDAAPSALLEAMLCGRPSVCVAVGFVNDWIENLKSGFIANEANLASFEEALSQAWRRKKEWEAIGKEASSIVKKYFPIDPAHQFFNQLNQLI